MTDQKDEKNLDQVRELIFGEQMRQNNQKFSAVDERFDDIKSEIAKAANETDRKFNHVQEEAQKLHDKLESHIEKVKNELSESLDSAKSQILKKIDQLTQEKSDRFELGNLLIEAGMRTKGENLMDTLQEKVETD